MHMLRNLTSLPTGAVFVVMLLATALWSQGAAAEHARYKNEIYPILKKHCVECHQPGGDGYEKSGLDMTTYKGLMKGTRYGPIVVPGDAFLSNLNVLIEGRAAPQIRMPYRSKVLSLRERLKIQSWVNGGALNN